MQRTGSARVSIPAAALPGIRLLGGGGATGRDLLIGGLGSGVLVGNRDEDILIAGTTAFDGDAEALAAVMAEWTSEERYADRVAQVRGEGGGPGRNGGHFLRAEGPGATVFDDGARDVLSGGHGPTGSSPTSMVRLRTASPTASGASGSTMWTDGRGGQGEARFQGAGLSPCVWLSRPPALPAAVGPTGCLRQGQVVAPPVRDGGRQRD
jgi:hypothetical protein